MCFVKQTIENDRLSKLSRKETAKLRANEIYFITLAIGVSSMEIL